MDHGRKPEKHVAAIKIDEAYDEVWRELLPRKGIFVVNFVASFVVFSC